MALQLACCKHWACGPLGARCNWEVAVWVGGLKAYVHVPDAARGRGVKIQWKRSGRLATLCHLGADHTHGPIPDTGMVMAHQLARAAPQVARESIHAMRLAGMSMGAIPKSTKVGNLLVAAPWQLVCCRRAMVAKPGFRNVVSRVQRQWLATKASIATPCSRGAPRLRDRAIGPNLRRCPTTTTQPCSFLLVMPCKAV